MALKRTLVDGKGFPHFGWHRSKDEVVLLDSYTFGDSVEVLTAGALPEADKIKFILLSKKQMKELADCQGRDFVYLHIDVEVSIDEKAIVAIWMAWVQSGRSRVAPRSSGGYRLLYRKQDGVWVFEKVLSAVFVS
jgi:hypothetical protein